MTVARISGYVGANGGGKTLAVMVQHVAPALEAGERVVANMHIEGGELLTSYKDIPSLRDCLLVLDEISSAFPSRESSKMPAEIARFLNQLRKANVKVVWTAPSWDRADKVLREVTSRVTVCSGHIGIRPKDEHGKRAQDAWPENRLFLWRTFAAEMLQEFRIGSTGQDRGKARLRPKSRQIYLRPRDGSGPQALYNTYEEVSLLDHLDTFGNCFQCGGSRRRPPCSCAKAEEDQGDDLADEPAPDLEVPSQDAPAVVP